jgi:glucuronyl/N-acetylglucosaminyl transferase EXT2
MMRRAVQTFSPTSLLPLSESPAEHQKSRPRRLRRRKLPHANNDWVSLDRNTILALTAGGVIAFCAIHLFLFHNIVNTTNHQAHVYSEENKVDRSDYHATVDENRVNASSGEDSKVILRSLAPLDYQQYTIRINTWKRLETLKVSLQHHSSCPGVAQIQVVWCTAQGPPPDWLQSFHTKVVVEEHDINSLNERFRIKHLAPTAGILSLDDDILRPCMAYDWAFFQWTQNPDRIVGFDARSHEVAGEKWKYAYMSTTEKTNRYSLTLTRCCFVHADYLDWYIHSPQLALIRQTVSEHLNCEDIGVSLAVSSQTGGLPPLLADYWVVKSMVKLDDGTNRKISATKDHKQVRDHCVDQFAELLGLKQSLQSAVLSHKSLFEYGDAATDWNALLNDEPQHLVDAKTRVGRWKADPHVVKEELAELRKEASTVAYNAGLVEGTGPWKKRFHPDDSR